MFIYSSDALIQHSPFRHSFNKDFKQECSGTVLWFGEVFCLSHNQEKKMLVFQLDCLINTVCSVAAPGAETPVMVQKSG